MSEVVSVRLDSDVVADLREIAGRRGCTVSDLLRQGALMEIEARRNVMTITWLTPPVVTMLNAGMSAAFTHDAGGQVDGSSAHTYVSTACLHGLHLKCRQACKYCGDPCECSGCDHSKVDLSYSPTYDQLRARVAELGRQLASAEGHAHRADANRLEADARLARAQAEIAGLKAAQAGGYADLYDEHRQLKDEHARRVDVLMAWCATHLGNSLIHRTIRELLAIPDGAYPWQTDLPPGQPDALEDLQARVAELHAQLDDTVGALSLEQLQRLFRVTRLYGCGFLLKHGTAQLELDPADVTIVWPAVHEATELEMRSRIHELEAERDLLGRQQEALIDLAADAESAHRDISPDEIYRIVTTDPGDDR